jgi:hypothetical protein
MVFSRVFLRHRRIARAVVEINITPSTNPAEPAPMIM